MEHLVIRIFLAIPDNNQAKSGKASCYLPATAYVWKSGETMEGHYSVVKI